MKKFTKIMAFAMLLLVTVPTIALAGNGRGEHDNDDRGRRGWKHFFSRGDHQDKQNRRGVSGTVTAKATNSFTVTGENNTVYTVNVDADTDFEKAFGVSAALTDVGVNSKVKVKGEVNGTTIMANKVVVTPPNTHPAKAKGTVTAVSGNTVTVQTNHQGVISNVTVKTDVNTQVTKADGNTAATSDVIVGSKIKVKGLWDEILNVLNAIKIRIKQ